MSYFDAAINYMFPKPTSNQTIDRPFLTHETVGSYLPSFVPNITKAIYPAELKSTKQSTDERKAALQAYGDCDIYVYKDGGWARHTTGELPRIIWVHCVTNDTVPGVYDGREDDASCAPQAIDNKGGGFCYQAAVFQVLYRTDLFGLLTPTLIRQLAPAFEAGQVDDVTCYALHSDVKSAYAAAMAFLFPAHNALTVTTFKGDTYAFLLGLCSMCPQIANNATFITSGYVPTEKSFYMSRLGSTPLSKITKQKARRPKLGDVVKVTDRASPHVGIEGKVQKVTSETATVQSHEVYHAQIELVCNTDWLFLQIQDIPQTNGKKDTLRHLLELVESHSDFGCKVVAGTMIINYIDVGWHVIMFSICEESGAVILRNAGVAKPISELLLNELDFDEFFVLKFELRKVHLVIDRRGQAMFANALRNGPASTIVQMLSADPKHDPSKVATFSPWGVDSPLEIAVIHNNVDTVKLLAWFVKPADFEDSNFIQCLKIASTFKYLSVLAVLKEALTKLWKTRTAKGDTLLHLKVATQQYKTVDWLLAENADPNVRNNTNSTPLLIATLNCNKEKKSTRQYMAEQLIAANADINAMDVYDQLPLTTAMYCGNLKLMQVLLESKADPNFSGGGETPLQKASATETVDAIKLLLAFRADPELGVYLDDGKPMTPLEIAEEHENENVVAFWKSYD